MGQIGKLPLWQYRCCAKFLLYYHKIQKEHALSKCFLLKAQHSDYQYLPEYLNTIPINFAHVHTKNYLKLDIHLHVYHKMIRDNLDRLIIRLQLLLTHFICKSSLWPNIVMNKFYKINCLRQSIKHQLYDEP